MFRRSTATQRSSAAPVALTSGLLVLAGLLAPASGASAGPVVPSRAASSSAASSPAWSGQAVLDPGLPTTGAAQRVVVSGASTAGAASAVRRLGGQVRADLPLVGGVAATVPAASLPVLAAASGVRAVTADRTGALTTDVWDDTTSASSFARTTQAATAWAGGDLGRGVGVAVLDTGVSPSPDLAGRLVQGPDLSGEGTVVDSHGHGTVMAGLVAGDGAESAGRAGGRWTGMAPAAHVVAVKVAGRNGAVDVSTVLQAMHWVSAYREQYGIRVLNLSWGVASTQRTEVDPIDYAVERLWSEGIVVVVAAGNSGPGDGTVTKPGDDPVVLTVGAFSDAGDTDPANDSVPKWSSRGPTAQGVAKPDLVAPGRSLVALRSHGSAVEQGYPKALVAPAYVRGSGTSQASAVTSGAVALLLAARPGLTPDEVKARLTSTAAPIAGTAATGQGAGRLQVAAAIAAPEVPVRAQPLRATGLGSLDTSRGGAWVTADCGNGVREVRGEMDVRCQPWDPATWAGVAWKGDAWTGVAWKGSEWDGVAWKGAAWSAATWTGVAWKGGTWTGGSWSGTSGWNGDRSVGSAWTGSAWTGVAWKDSSWTGVAWKDTGWSGGSGTSTDGDDLLTAFWGSTPPPGRVVAGEPVTSAGRPTPRRGPDDQGGDE